MLSAQRHVGHKKSNCYNSYNTSDIKGFHYTRIFSNVLFSIVANYTSDRDNSTVYGIYDVIVTIVVSFAILKPIKLL